MTTAPVPVIRLSLAYRFAGGLSVVEGEFPEAGIIEIITPQPRESEELRRAIIFIICQEPGCGAGVERCEGAAQWVHYYNQAQTL